MIHIVPYAPVYAAGVVDVILPIQQEEFGVAVTLQDQPDLLDIPGYYQRNAGNFWVALDGDAVVGTIALLDIGNGQAALRKMFVRAVWRGREHGVAQRLLDTLLVWSREQGLREIFLGTTAQFLAAHRFYDKNGFEEITQSVLPASFPLMTVDTKFYRQWL